MGVMKKILLSAVLLSLFLFSTIGFKTVEAAPNVIPTLAPPAITTGCNGTDELNTAIGCIPFGDTNALVGFILRWAIGVGGGIAFILIVIAAFQIMSSSGDPERLKAGQELLTSALAGLIMLIFSVFILKVIGVDILGLPGL
jgi:hypothetical protein